MEGNNINFTVDEFKWINTEKLKRHEFISSATKKLIVSMMKCLSILGLQKNMKDGPNMNFSSDGYEFGM